MANEDYTSRVPYYTFADTLEEQEAQLETNPLMQRLNAYRKTYEGDPHRPIYHYINPEAMLNDPNGLCFWQGRWHLFYQAYPPEDTRQHWGHAISDDLIHWRDLPYAIYPNPERCCFSGATVVEEDRVIAMYHGTVVGNMVAVSSDPLLLNWKKSLTKRLSLRNTPMAQHRSIAFSTRASGKKTVCITRFRVAHSHTDRAVNGYARIFCSAQQTSQTGFIYIPLLKMICTL